MIKITAGKFYRIREGRVVGPAKRNTTGRNELSHPWLVGGLTYAEDGAYYKPFGTDLDIVEEMPEGWEPEWRFAYEVKAKIGETRLDEPEKL